MKSCPNQIGFMPKFILTFFDFETLSKVKKLPKLCGWDVGGGLCILADGGSVADGGQEQT